MPTGDFLTPIFGNNRDEIILVEYDGFIKNKTEAILLSMISTKQIWIDKYPGINKYENISSDQIYQDSFLKLPESLLYNLSNKSLSIKTIKDDIDKLQKIDILQCQRFTIIEFAIKTLLLEKFVKTVYIIKEEDYTSKELLYLKNNYEIFEDKIKILCGNTLEAFSMCKPTTYFTNSLYKIENIIKDESITDKLFILRNTEDILNYNESTNIFTLKPEILSKIENINKEKKNYIGTVFTVPKPNDKNNEPVG